MRNTGLPPSRGWPLCLSTRCPRWPTDRRPPSSSWSRPAINGFGALLTALTTVIELVSKFTEGAWLIVIVIPGLVLLFNRVRGSYARIGALLGIGQTPGPPIKHKSLVVVPVASISRHEGKMTALASRIARKD